MAEVFGDKTDFAIEAEIEPDRHTASTVWGHMCVWCRGVALGNIEERYCGLYESYSNFDWLAINIGKLWDDELADLEDIATWNFLDGLLYGYHGDIELQNDKTLLECRLDAMRWGRFNFLTNWGEQFDGYKSFIVCPPGENVHILSRRLPRHCGRIVKVSRHNLVLVSGKFARWFEDESHRLGIPCLKQAE